MSTTVNQSQNLLEENVLYGCDGEVADTISKSEGIVFFIVSLVIIAVSIGGNSLLCFAVYKFKSLRKKSNFLLCSLAVTDLLTPVMRLLSMALAVIYRKWIFSCDWCKLSSCLGMFFCSASILHLCVITFERYVMIKYPYKYDTLITNHRIGAVILFIWMISFLMFALPYLDVAKISFSKDLLDCEIHLGHKPILSLVLAFCYFCLPFFIMVGAYYQIYGEAKLQNKKIKTLSISAYRENDKHRFIREWKTAKTIVIVIGLFFSLWLPYFSLNIVRSFNPDAIGGWILRLVIIMTYTNSCCNWLVYCIMNRKIRKSFSRIVTCNFDIMNRLSVLSENLSSAAVTLEFKKTLTSSKQSDGCTAGVFHRRNDTKNTF